MLGVVCKTHHGLKPLHTYDIKGVMNKSSGLQSTDTSIGRPFDHRYLFICLENIRFELQMKELKWERVRFVEDLQREQTLITNAKKKFEIRKQEHVNFLSQRSSNLSRMYA
uniref:Uncharacterized protein n=1 Tax=Solanum lycopersicum TaxID=4081 RepID=K4D7P9_SOLLC